MVGGQALFAPLAAEVLLTRTLPTLAHAVPAANLEDVNDHNLHNAHTVHDMHDVHNVHDVHDEPDALLTFPTCSPNVVMQVSLPVLHSQ